MHTTCIQDVCDWRTKWEAASSKNLEKKISANNLKQNHKTNQSCPPLFSQSWKELKTKAQRVYRVDGRLGGAEVRLRGIRDGLVPANSLRFTS